MRRILILIILIMFVFTFSACNQEPMNDGVVNTSGNTSANIMNGGFVAKQGDWLYYCYIANGGFKEGLYRSTIDGKHRKKIDNGRINSINIIGNWIYYVKEEKNMNYPKNNITKLSLYKININGSQRTKLIEDCDNVSIIGNQIYYSIDTAIELYEKAEIDYPLMKDFGNIYRANINDIHNRTLVEKGAMGYYIEGNNLYYIKNYLEDNSNLYLYKLNLKTGVGTEVLNKPEYYFTVKGDAIFYIDNNNQSILKCFSQTSGKTETIYSSRDQISQPAVSGNFIFCLDSYENVFKIGLANVKSISNIGTADYIYVFGDTVVLWKYSKYPMVVQS